MVQANIGGRNKENLRGVCMWGSDGMQHEEVFGG